MRDRRCVEAVLGAIAVVRDAQVVTNHAITIDAPPRAVWPWLVQMGSGRGGWYTDTIVRELQHLDVGDFVMARGMLHGVRARAEQLTRPRANAAVSA